MKKIVLIMTFALSAVTASAQTLRSAYFLDGYTYRHQFNPAFQGNRSFVGLPAIGKTGYDIFVNDLGYDKMVDGNLDMNIFGFGFRLNKSYHTVDLSVKTNVDMSLPGDLFKFMKSGFNQDIRSYNFSNLGVVGNRYLQLSYGFSRRFKDKVNVGVRVKGLLGVGSVVSEFKKLSVEMDKDKWIITAGGTTYVSEFVKRLYNGDIEDNPFKELPRIFEKPNGGFAVDFGFSVDIWKYLTVSASILDLGAINWRNVDVYKFSSDSWTSDITDISISDFESGDINEMFTQALGELTHLISFETHTPEKKKNDMEALAFTTHIGIEGRLPIYTKLSAGILATHKYNGPHSWTEGRFSVNWAILHWLSMSASYAISDFGQSYGAALSIHPKGFAFFIGTDSFKSARLFSGKIKSINDINTDLVFGINFPFGS